MQKATMLMSEKTAVSVTAIIRDVTQRGRKVLVDWWRNPEVRMGLSLWGASRLVFVLLTIAGIVLDPVGSQNPNHPARTLPDLVNAWMIWDAGWYINIAHYGYTRFFEAGFFPLYPLLEHIVATIIGPYWPLIALLVSNGALLVACVGIAVWARQQETSPLWTLRAYLAYPLALFLTAGYTESLFLALAVWSLILAERRQPLAALPLAFFAGLTRATALALVLPLAWYAWQQRPSWRSWLAAAGPISGIGAYAVYCALRWHDPLAFIHGQSANGHVAIWPWQAAWVAVVQLFQAPFLSYVEARILIDLAPLVGAIALTIVAARRLSLPMTLYCAGIVGITLLTAPVPTALFPDIYAAAGRYVLLAFPLAALIGQSMQRRAWLDQLVMAGGWGLQAIFLLFLFRHGWLV